MDEPGRALKCEALTVENQEILQRFKKLFGREMTPRERQAFFLGPDPSEEKAS